MHSHDVRAPLPLFVRENIGTCVFWLYIKDQNYYCILVIETLQRIFEVSCCDIHHIYHTDYGDAANLFVVLSEPSLSNYSLLTDSKNWLVLLLLRKLRTYFIINHYSYLIPKFFRALDDLCTFYHELLLQNWSILEKTRYTVCTLFQKLLSCVWSSACAHTHINIYTYIYIFIPIYTYASVFIPQCAMRCTYALICFEVQCTTWSSASTNKAL